MITKQEIINANKKLRCNLNSILEHPLVRDISDERPNDGIWIYLQDGWNWDGCNSIHEDTISECIRCLKNVYYDSETLDYANDTEYKLSE